MNSQFRPVASLICFEENRVEVDLFTKLIKFCISLDQFVGMGWKLCPNSTDLKVKDFHLEFRDAMFYWLENFLFLLVEREVDSDDLKFYNDSTKYSSSAGNIFDVINQIKSLLEQLGLKEKEKCALQISQSCMFYAEKMCKRVDKLLRETEGVNFQIPSEWCVIINDVDLVRRSVQSMIEVLEINANILEESVTFVKLDVKHHLVKISDTIEIIMEKVIRKLDPVIMQYLNENASPDSIGVYMKECLKILVDTIDEDIIEKVFNAILTALAQKCQKIQKNTDFYKNLRITLKRMVNAFMQKEGRMFIKHLKSSIELIDELLELYEYETPYLIHLYYMKCHEIQSKNSDPPLDRVRGIFLLHKNEIQIDKLAIVYENIMGDNSKYKSFLKIQLLLEDELGRFNIQTEVAIGPQILKLKDEYNL